jgi:hypothetical protein
LQEACPLIDQRNNSNDMAEGCFVTGIF